LLITLLSGGNVAEKKKNGGWSEPIISGPKKNKAVKKPSTKRPSLTWTPVGVTWDGTKWVSFKRDTQRSGMAATRKKATAKRPNRPVSVADAKKANQRRKDAEMDARANSRVAKQSRERMKYQGR